MVSWVGIVGLYIGHKGYPGPWVRIDGLYIGHKWYPGLGLLVCILVTKGILIPGLGLMVCILVTNGILGWDCWSVYWSQRVSWVRIDGLYIGHKGYPGLGLLVCTLQVLCYTLVTNSVQRCFFKCV